MLIGTESMGGVTTDLREVGVIVDATGDSITAGMSKIFLKLGFLYEGVYVADWQRLARNKGRSILYKWDGKYAYRSTVVKNEEEARKQQGLPLRWRGGKEIWGYKENCTPFICGV
jgi:hypothetical protein